MWMMLDVLDDSWRPDRSGVVLRPENLGSNEITVLVVDPGPFLLSEKFTAALAGWIEAGMTVKLSLPSKLGHFPAITDATPHLAPFVAARDHMGFMMKLVECLKVLGRTATIADGLTLSTTL